MNEGSDKPFRLFGTMKHIFLTLLITLAPFLGWNQLNWVKYDENPVLKRDTVIENLANDFFAISDNWVLKEGSTYKMWYTCGGFNHPTDEFNMRARICYCESEDGIVWNKYEDNPVLDAAYDGGWDSLAVETATVIIDEDASLDERYKMWYAGETETGGKYNLGYATSPDGLVWTKHGAPILEVGADSEWDNYFLEGPTVIKEGGTYKMWYAGFDLTFDGASTDGFVNIGYATSTDGISWEKYAGNPVLRVSESGWDSIYVQDPHVIKVGETYHLWYGGANQYDNYGQATGYASSTDGINWTKSPENPVLTPGELGEWDANTTSFPTVLLDSDGQLKMWYTGKDVHPLPEGSSNYYWEIGYAIGDSLTLSTQENKWVDFKVYPNPVQELININSPKNNLQTIEIADLSGQIVYRKSFSERSSVQVNLKNLTSGIYLLIINNQPPIKLIKH